MSKMRTPEMEVVRFTQSDVIVASGASVPTTMTVTGWRDGIKDNLELNYGGTVYTNSNRSDLIDLLSDNGQNENAVTSAGSDFTITQLFQVEAKNDGTSKSLTGLEWDAANNYWITRQ